MAPVEAGLLDYPGVWLLASRDSQFVAELVTRATAIRQGRLAPAEIHNHPHIHEHAHIHLEHASSKN